MFCDGKSDKDPDPDLHGSALVGSQLRKKDGFGSALKLMRIRNTFKSVIFYKKFHKTDADHSRFFRLRYYVRKSLHKNMVKEKIVHK
jgi:hypothetical protein